LNPDSVHDKATLITYLKELSLNFRESPQDWENRDVSAYLDAAAAWIEDMDGFFVNRNEPVPESPSWRLIAQVLTAAKMYE
jgi:hypothetical protein